LKEKTNIIFPIIKYTIFFGGVLWMMYSLTLDLKEDRKSFSTKSNSIEYSPISKGILLYKNGELDKASELFDQIVKADPSKYDNRLMLAEIYHDQCILKDTNCELALWQLDFLIEKFPTKIRPLEMRSKIFLKLKDTVSSRNDVESILRLKRN